MYIFVGDAVPSVPFAVGKETPEGVNTMTDVWEEYAELTKLPLAEIEALQATI